MCACSAPASGAVPRSRRWCRLSFCARSTPLVLDADALFAVAQDVTVLDRARAPIVLTPHDGEFARLAGADASRQGRGGVRFCRPRTAAPSCARAGDGLCIPGRGHGRAARRQSRYGQGRQR
ncbi:MAG: NAD(P)H-hydrate dehydratase [Oscillospiraceae bacterium]